MSKLASDSRRLRALDFVMIYVDMDFFPIFFMIFYATHAYTRLARSQHFLIDLRSPVSLMTRIFHTHSMPFRFYITELPVSFGPPLHLTSPHLSPFDNDLELFWLSCA